jgi:hypothetical protein
MKRKIAGFTAALALVAAAPGSPATADTSADGTGTAHAACTYHRIAGQRKCIAAGQYCQHTRRANRDYHRYGYHCGKRDSRGNFHLVYR